MPRRNVEMRTMRAKQRGFTLIELMVVVLIIAIALVTFQPTFALAMAQRRAGLMARELVRLGRRAQSDAMGTQRAHVLWISPTEVRLLRGRTGSCVENTTWSQIFAACTAGTSEGRRPCLERLLTTSDFFSRAPFAVAIARVPSTAPTAATSALAAALCYSPSGAVYSAATDGTTLSAGPFTDTSTLTLDSSNAAVGGAAATAVAGGSGLLVRVQTIDTSQENALVGVPRHVLFPKGTTPRVVQ
jgi:prepilin-type N-terminal cleavage/methylation domain-containing protein